LDEQGNDKVTTPATTITDLKENWPFLFTSKGLNLHYLLLSGVDFKEKLQVYVNEDGKRVIDFLSCKNERMSQLKRRMEMAERQGHRATVFPTLLKMLTVNFGEELKFLMILVEV